MDDPGSSLILLAIDWSTALPVIFTSIILIILLASSALVSGSEVAFFSLSPQDREAIKNKESKRSKVAIDLLGKPKELLATILIANNFINVAIILVSAYLSDTLLPPDSIGETSKFIIDVILLLCAPGVLKS